MNRIRTRSKGFMLFSIYSVPFVKPNTIYCVLNTNFVLHIDCSLFIVHGLSTLIIVTLKEFLDFVNRIRLSFQSCVSVDVQSGGHFAVPKPLLNDFRVDAARQQYCCVSVSERVLMHLCI